MRSARVWESFSTAAIRAHICPSSSLSIMRLSVKPILIQTSIAISHYPILILEFEP